LITCFLFLSSYSWCQSPTADENHLFNSLPDTLFSDIQSKQRFQQEVFRAAILELGDKVKYLMRFDPPQHCTRIIMCKTDGQKTCDDPDAKGNRVMLLPLEKKILDKDALNPEIYTGDVISIISTDNTLHFKNNGIKKKFSLKSNKVRIETSSFYCNIRVAEHNTNKEQIPGMKALTIKDYGDDTTPFQIGKAKPSTFRKYLGPVFRGNGDLSLANVNLEVEKDMQCPFPHEWSGFAKWEKSAKIGNSIWNNPSLRYSLSTTVTSSTATALDTDGKCGDSHAPYSIDIELDNTFDPIMNNGNNRCFGFALVFGVADAEWSNVDTKPISPSHTFEFYPASMILIGPDSEQARSLRVARDNIRRIRISFVTRKLQAGIKNQLSETQPYAVVEYGFLNSRVAGVREYFAIPKEIENIGNVRVFSEGLCNVRLVNAMLPISDVDHTNPTKWIEHMDPSNLCMRISGCDIMRQKA
ncbi:hypothetical protein PFISCL1PPCAC_25282, partial [Pristionchus fissidentatus]